MIMVILFNVVDDWNEESVVPHISFCFISYWFLNARFHSYSVGPSCNVWRVYIWQISIRNSIRMQTVDSHVPTL